MEMEKKGEGRPKDCLERVGDIPKANRTTSFKQKSLLHNIEWVKG